MPVGARAFAKKAGPETVVPRTDREFPVAEVVPLTLVSALGSDDYHDVTVFCLHRDDMGQILETIELSFDLLLINFLELCFGGGYSILALGSQFVSSGVKLTEPFRQPFDFGIGVCELPVDLFDTLLAVLG